MNQKPLTIADLSLTLNGTFARSASKLLDEDVDAIIEAARANEIAESAPLLDVHRTCIDGATVSALVYYSQRDAYFAPNFEIFDTIASYIVIIEINDTEFVIFKKACSPISSVLDKRFDVASYDDLLNTFDDSRSSIQKLSAREMSVSDKGIKVRSYEAPDLKGHLSPHSAGRSIPRFTQVRSKERIRSLSLTTGRINQLTDRSGILRAISWARENFELMAKERVNKSFFSVFAQRISLDDVLKSARPASILFERSSIEVGLNDDGLDLWYSSRGVYKRFSSRAVRRILDALDAAFEIDAQSKMVGAKNAQLRVNKKTLSPQIKVLEKIKIKQSKGFVTFQSWITDNGHFIVSFDRPEYIYVNKSCFKDRAGRSEVDSILKCLKSVPAFANAKSEKGAPTPVSTAFDVDCMFSIVEGLHAAEDYIFCDDLGTEWADHICIDLASASVTFIHSKYSKKPSSSASALHEVVGQAIKNLGYMHFSHGSFSHKVNSKFKKTYSRTSIERTRKGAVVKVNSDIKSLLGDHRLHRKCVVACTSLSLQSISSEFAKMKAGRPVAGHVTQLFWILSSFIHATIGASSSPVVYCQP